MLVNYRVSLDFANYGDADLDEFTGNTITSLTGNASFPTPPVTPLILSGLNTTFHNALLAAMPGGTILTAAKNAARLNVIGALRQNAAYIQIHAGQNLPMLLSSGYYANSTNRAQSPLPQPVIELVDNYQTTQLLLRVAPVTNAKAYEVQLTNGSNPPVDAGTFTQARRIILPGLTPGMTYAVRVRAVGGSSGYSEWSDPVSHIAT